MNEKLKYQKQWPDIIKLLLFDRNSARSLLNKVQKEIETTKKYTKKYTWLHIITMELKADIHLAETCIEWYLEEGITEKNRDLLDNHRGKIKAGIEMSKSLLEDPSNIVDVKPKRKRKREDI